MVLKVALLNGGTPDHVGIIPLWLHEEDPRPAREQLNSNYGHGGGWQPFKGFKLLRNHSIQYPGDPPLQPLAIMRLRDEMIAVYPHSWVMILQKDGSHEICRMD
jgi:hypothetical protein